MSLAFENVGAAYHRRTVFAGATFTMQPGTLMGLIGANGAGKTTLLRIAAGLIAPASGRVTASGRVMYFGGESTLPGQCRADEWAALFNAGSNTRARLGRLSRGTRQLFGLTVFLSNDVWDIGLLDEPWEGLDPNGSRWLAAALRRHRERGACVLISSHRLHDVADVCSAYTFLSAGALRVATAGDLARAGKAVDAADLARAFDALERQ
ncbi:MAG: ATP-binding cassette domain-containing protein [Vicinamibacterales bacterium]